MKNGLQWLNIVSMEPEHRQEIVDDIREMYRRDCITETAFIMTLVPEGDPPVDKPRLLGERFEAFRRALGPTDMPVGILVQATIGHGWAPNAQAGFQKMVLPDGSSPYRFCPLDEGFRSYIEEGIRHLAGLKPDFMMVDDDFRMYTGHPGCFCPLHLEAFNRRTGGHYTRESLLEAVHADAEIAAAYDRLLLDSLLELAGGIRRAIDAAAPGLSCSFCFAAGDLGHAPAIAAALAAEGQQGNVRINNSRYLNESLRTLPEWLMQTARQIAAFPADYRVLAEPDTFPHNRYSTSAAMMHAQLTHSLLEGAKGGKLWLSRIGAWEPESGRLYRETLAANAAFYRTLAGLDVAWEGCATPLPERPPLNFPTDRIPAGQNLTWSTQLFGKMGIPFYFARHPAGIVTLGAADCRVLSDPEVKSILEQKGVLVDAAAAMALTERGFTPLLGVEARPWQGKAVTFEKTAAGDAIPVSAALPMAELRLLPGTLERSQLFHRPSGESAESEYLAPALTVRVNAAGGRVAVSAVPLIHYDYEAFVWLNQSRKAQLLALLDELGGLPLYWQGDDEILLKTGRTPTGERIVTLTDLSLDDVPEIRLAGCHQPPQRVELLDAAGGWRPLAFTCRDGLLCIPLELRPLRPAILRLTPG